MTKRSLEREKGDEFLFWFVFALFSFVLYFIEIDTWDKEEEVLGRGAEEEEEEEEKESMRSLMVSKTLLKLFSLV